MQVARAQASVELISILGISLIVILVFSVLSSDFLSDIGVNRNYADAKDTVQKLASAADSVYAQGEGASMTVLVKIPANADLAVNISYIGKPNSSSAGVASNQISLRLENTDVLAVTKETVTGSFPRVPGTYYMRVVSKGSYVAIGTHYLDADKSSIYQSMAPSEARSETVNFKAVGNESVTVIITKDWGYTNVALDLSTSSFSLAAGGSQAVVATITAGASSGGLYNSALTVNATAANGVSEIFTIPITADVQG